MAWGSASQEFGGVFVFLEGSAKGKREITGGRP